MKKIVKSVRLSEIQAISIYEAEVFWVRSAGRRKMLREILGEERAHDSELAEFGEPARLSILLSKIFGWVFGSLLAFLPWKVMCTVQAWAEDEASKIYAGAAEVILRENGGNESELIRRLHHARDQESEHGRRFRNPAVRGI